MPAAPRLRLLLTGVALALLVAATFGGSLFGDELLAARDLPRQFYPRCALIGEALARGEVPRWNPWCGHGAPWFGPRAGGVVYPAHLLFAVLPLGRAMAAFVALHTLLALVGAWRLSRLDRGGASLAGALAFGLGGFVVSQHWALPYLVSAAWLPWGLVGARRLSTGDLRGVALCGVAVAMCLLAGEPQGGAVLGLLALTTALVHAPAGRHAGATLRCALAGALGIAAGGLTVLSTLHELPTLDRGLSTWSELRYALHAPALLVDVILPGVHGAQAEHVGGFWGAAAWGYDMPWCSLAVGALGLAALASSGLGGAWRRAPWREAAAWVVLGLALAAVDAGAPLGLRYPSKWLVISALGLARLVGLGVARLAAGGAPRAGPALLVAGACVVALGLGVALGGEQVGAWLSDQAPGYVLPARAQTAAAQALLRAGLAALVAGAACAWIAQRRPTPATARALLLGALALDLLTAGQAEVLTFDRTRAPFLDRPRLVTRLHAQAGGPEGAPVRFEPKQVFYRHELRYKPLVQPARELHARDALRPNVGYRWGVRTVLAFESVEPVAVHELLHDPRWAALPLLQRTALLDADLLLVDRADAPDLGVPPDKVRIFAELTPHDGDQPVTGTPYDDLVAAKNPLCPPWAYLAPAAVLAPDVARARDLLLEPGAGPWARVVIGPEGAAAGLTDGAQGAVRVEAFEPERIELDVDARADAWLVVREAHSPDWRATLDGVPVAFARADLLYRAVRVPVGAHRVVFEYAPPWWRPALTLTALGFAALLALALRGARATTPS